ncbi:MAG: hypothetical protein IJT08_00860, partial [Alphaproteobacteria bacterium]|nr:hypothetical protein [Alphaproteobacteria bacterium]
MKKAGQLRTNVGNDNIGYSKQLCAHLEDRELKTANCNHSELFFFFQKGRKNNLICRAAVKPEGRSPKSKPTGAAWLDGSTKGKSVQCVPPFGKNNSL